MKKAPPLPLPPFWKIRGQCPSHFPCLWRFWSQMANCTYLLVYYRYILAVEIFSSSCAKF